MAHMKRHELTAMLRDIHDQSGSGVLEVLGPAGLVQIHFRAGKVVHVVPPRGSEWQLGTLLVESGALSARRCAKLLRRRERAGKPLEFILIEHGVVTRDVLSKYLEVQLRETVVPLLLSDIQQAEFREDPPRVNDFVRAVTVPVLLREAERRAKDLPILRRSGIVAETVFDKSDEAILALFGSPDHHDASNLSASERIAFYYVDGAMTVREIAFASCLGKYETVKALYKLKQQGYIHSVEGEQRRRPRRGHSFASVAVTVLFSLLLVGLGAGVILHGPLRLAQPTLLLETALDEKSSAVICAHRKQLRTAIDVFFALHGRYPETLMELGRRGFLDLEESARMALVFNYQPSSDGYYLGVRGQE